MLGTNSTKALFWVLMSCFKLLALLINIGIGSKALPTTNTLSLLDPFVSYNRNEFITLVPGYKP